MAMWISAALACLALALAFPVPRLLARSQWPLAHPVLALLVWQSVGLAGGMSIVGALVVAGLSPHVPLASTVPDYLAGRAAPDWDAHSFLLVLGCLLYAYLAFRLVLMWLANMRERQRQRDLVRLLSEPSALHDQTVILDHRVPAAYCLPGGAKSLTVLTQGLLDLLKPAEVAVVVAHEKAHLNQHHHWLTLAFSAWRGALPFLPTAELAHRNVTVLVETLADKAASAAAPPTVVAQAIVLAATGGGPDVGGQERPPHDEARGPAVSGAVAWADQPTTTRVKKLLDPPTPLSTGAQLLWGAFAFLLVAAPTLMVPYALL